MSKVMGYILGCIAGLAVGGVAQAQTVQVTVHNPNNRSVTLLGLSEVGASSHATGSIDAHGSGQVSSRPDNTYGSMLIFEYGTTEQACRSWVFFSKDENGNIKKDRQPYTLPSNGMPGHIPICTGGTMTEVGPDQLVWSVTIQLQ